MKSPLQTPRDLQAIVFVLGVLAMTGAVTVRGMSTGGQMITVKPDSVQINEGDNVFLRCVVLNQRGKVQWTKDGFALGFERDVPGYPRYSYLGDSSKGEHHLVIEGATLEDDGEYQCQVGPTSITRALWASANVTVMVSPTSISLLRGGDGTEVVAIAGQQLRLQCLVKEARPAPSVAWYRNGLMLDEGMHRERVELSSLEKRWNVWSRLSLLPEAEDDGQQYSCRALHPSLMNSPTSLVASVTLSVLHPPKPPTIRGYSSGEVLKEGQDLTLTCQSKGGNPRPRITWYRNARFLSHANITRIRPTSENEGVIVSLRLEVKAEDDRAVYECRVTNDILKEPLSHSVIFNVHYSPSLVVVTGPSVATAGEEFTLTCVTSRANPSASINWLVHGLQVATVNSLVSEADEAGGWVTSSDLRYQVDRSLRLSQISVECAAHNAASDKVVGQSHLITIIKPPGRPILQVEGAGDVVAGSRLVMVCISEGGNPHPGVTIYKGTQKLLTKVVKEGRVTRARASTEVVASDNGVRATCEVSNQATRTPLVAHTNIELLFSPWEVSAWVSPTNVEAGQVVTLICESSSSLPPAVVTWRSGVLILHGATFSHAPGMYGGTVTRSELEVRALIEDNGRLFSCDANNGLGITVTTNVTLDVLHGPIWITVPTGTIDVQEKDDLVLTAAANSNPPPVTYCWWRGPLMLEGVKSEEEDAEGRLVGGARLEIQRIHRQEAGGYSVSASSPRGKVNGTFVINVLYGPESLRAAERVTVDEGGSTSVLCSAVGNPAPNVTWFRRRTGESSSDGEALTWGIGESRVPIHQAKRDDTGIYLCRAFNVVSASSPTQTAVVVTQAPEPPLYVRGRKALRRRFWARTGGTGRLECIVGAAPPPNFRWTINEDRVLFNSRKYFIRRPKLLDGLVAWSSVLEVRHVTLMDYKNYTCKATNSRGTYTANIELGPPLSPLQPQNLSATTIMGSTAVLSWIPPAEGTLPDGYTLKYRLQEGHKYTEVRVEGEERSTTQVQGLTPGTVYEFVIRSYNDQGKSGYTSPPITVTVPGVKEEVASSSSQPRVPRLTLVLMSLTGAALLALNISIIICFVRRFTATRRPPRSSYKVRAVETYYTPASTPGLATDDDDRTASSDTLSSPLHHQVTRQSSVIKGEESSSGLSVHHHSSADTSSLKPPEKPLMSVSPSEQLIVIASPSKTRKSALMNGGLSVYKSGRASTANAESLCEGNHTPEHFMETKVDWLPESSQQLDDNITNRMKVTIHPPDIPDVCPKSPGSGGVRPRRRSREVRDFEDDEISLISHYSNTSYVNLHDQAAHGGLGRHTPMNQQQRHLDNPSPPLLLMHSTPTKLPSMPSSYGISAKSFPSGKSQAQEDLPTSTCLTAKPRSQVIYHGQPHIQQQHEQQQYQEHLQLLGHHQHLEHKTPVHHHHEDCPRQQHHHQHQDDRQHLEQYHPFEYHEHRDQHHLQHLQHHEQLDSHQHPNPQQMQHQEHQEILTPYCHQTDNREGYHPMPCCQQLAFPSYAGETREHQYSQHRKHPSYSSQSSGHLVVPYNQYKSHSLPRNRSSHNAFYSSSHHQHPTLCSQRSSPYPMALQDPFSHQQMQASQKLATGLPRHIPHSQSEHQYPVHFRDAKCYKWFKESTEEYSMQDLGKDIHRPYDSADYSSQIDPSPLYAVDRPTTCRDECKGTETTIEL